MLPALGRKYLVESLEGNVGLLALLTGDIPEGDPRWESRPDPERFSLREILAHFATLEPIWLARAQAILSEDLPLFEPAPLLSDSCAARSPHVNWATYMNNRRQLTALLRNIDDSQWLRPARSESLGDLTLETLAVFILTHDGTHLRQINELLDP